jgi:glutathione S-transferase
MAIVFYTAPRSSASPVASALAELNVPHESVTFELAAGKQKQPEFLALNPNGKVPTLVVDGTPMFEALAILTWLGERFGPERGLWPREGDPARLTAVSWCTWSYVTYVGSLSLWFFSSSEYANRELHNPALAALAREQLEGHLRILEERLGRHKYMLGAEYSLVDLVVASVVGYGVSLGVPVDGFARVQAWLAELQSRASFKSVLLS